MKEREEIYYIIIIIIYYWYYYYVFMYRDGVMAKGTRPSFVNDLGFIIWDE